MATNTKRKQPTARPLTAAMKVTAMAVEKVRPYPGNPRNSGGAIEKVARSIRTFGWRQPIVVDEQGVILAGHTRYYAAQSIGLTKVPVHVAMGLTPAEARAYRLADNRTAEQAEWNDELLAAELRTLQADAFDLDATAFDAGELGTLLANAVGDAPGTVSRGPATPIIRYELIFDTEEQQEQWFAFLRWLKATEPYGRLATIGARVAAFTETLLIEMEADLDPPARHRARGR